MNRKLALCAAILTLLLLATATARSQIIYGQPSSGGLTLTYSHWTVKRTADSTTTIGQLATPLGVFVPLADNRELLVSAAGAFNRLEQPGASNQKLSGFSDVKLQYNQSFADDRLLLSLGLNLPTGKRRLSPGDEENVLLMLSNDFLSFPIRRTGEGLGVNILVGGAQMLGAWRCGGSLSYYYQGEYKPYDWRDNYNPGDAFSAGLSADREFGAVTAGGGIKVTLFGTDKEGDKDRLKLGTRVDLSVFGRWHSGDNSSLEGQIGYLIRGDYKTYQHDTAGTSESESRIFGNQFVSSLAYSRQLSPRFTMIPSAELRLIGAVDGRLGSATIAGLGSGAQYELGESLRLDSSFEYCFGNANGGDWDVSGYQLSAGVVLTR